MNRIPKGLIVKPSGWNMPYSQFLAWDASGRLYAGDRSSPDGVNYEPGVVLFFRATNSAGSKIAFRMMESDILMGGGNC